MGTPTGLPRLFSTAETETVFEQDAFLWEPKISPMPDHRQNRRQSDKHHTVRRRNCQIGVFYLKYEKTALVGDACIVPIIHPPTYSPHSDIEQRVRQENEHPREIPESKETKMALLRLTS